MGIEGSWEAYQFDSAVQAVGVKVDNALAENSNLDKKKRKPPKWVIMTTLGLEPNDVGLKYGSLGDKVTATVKRKTGEDWFNAIREWENAEKRDKPTGSTGPSKRW